jgi:hypothetical protein
MAITSSDVINLIKKKDYETVQIIDSFDAFKQFSGNLRQDWYSENKLEENKLFQRVKKWLSEHETGKYKFYVVITDPDNFARNDSWGSSTLHEYIAFWSGNTLKVMGSEVQNFAH